MRAFYTQPMRTLLVTFNMAALIALLVVGPKGQPTLWWIAVVANILGIGLNAVILALRKS